ncbi:hypothetical protein AC579_5170 [Pseudocercospora musae]|uniref:Uncharacterized protein n=1 Tax=Pseudocercospora musae TaxID=113226 RepID=A0A139I027_9PEZI|nr:hypothetical protein AC579_5170 [Pseudocercospora musae]
MLQKHVLDTEDFSKWRLQHCHDAGQRLLVFDPHRQTSRALLRAVQTFWTLTPNTDISFHFSTEECTRPRYGSNRDGLTDNQSLQCDQHARSRAMDISRLWSRRPLSHLTEASWPPQHVGRLNIMLHFDPPSPKSTSGLPSRERYLMKSYSEIGFAGFEDNEIPPYSASALQRLSKIRAGKAALNVRASPKRTSASMEDAAMTDAEKSASGGQVKAIHDGMHTKQPIQVPSLSGTNTSHPIIPQHRRKRPKLANAEPGSGVQGRNKAIRRASDAVAAPAPMELNNMPASKHFQTTPDTTSSPAQQRFGSSIEIAGTTSDVQSGQSPMHFSNWTGPTINTFGHDINASDRNPPDNRNPTPSMTLAPTAPNRRGGIADAIRRRSKASLGFGAGAMQSPFPKQNNTGGLGGVTDRNKPYDHPSSHSTQTDMTENHLDPEQRVHSSLHSHCPTKEPPRQTKNLKKPPSGYRTPWQI